MSNATVYCAAPTSEVLPHVGDPADYLEISDLNDSYVGYQSLLELWEPTDAAALERARRVAAALDAAGIVVAIALDEDPVPYVA